MKREDYTLGFFSSFCYPETLQSLKQIQKLEFLLIEGSSSQKKSFILQVFDKSLH